MSGLFLRITKPPVFLLSELTHLEMSSSSARWTWMKEIDEPQAELIENTFDQDVHSWLYLIRPVGSTQYRRAEKWISARETALRTLDALHMAYCLEELLNHLNLLPNVYIPSDV